MPVYGTRRNRKAFVFISVIAVVVVTPSDRSDLLLFFYFVLWVEYNIYLYASVLSRPVPGILFS